MVKNYGWVGKMLRVDMTDGSISIEKTSKYEPEKFIGGEGIAYKIAWNEIKPKTDPFGPENKLIFLTGPLTGTLAPCSGRGEVFGVSPRIYPEPWFTYSGMGGHWAPELKFSGYDGIIIQGKAEEPKYIRINDDEVEIKDAKDLWGMGSIGTQIKLIEKEGDGTQVICIGPGGENQSRVATIQHRLENATGQTGFGGVMGAKRLKAITIKGTGSVNIAEPEEFLKVCKEVGNLLRGPPTPLSFVGSKVRPPNSIPCSYACVVNCPIVLVRNLPRKLSGGTLDVWDHCVPSFWVEGWSRTQYRGKGIDVEPFAGFGNPEGDELKIFNEDLGLSNWYVVNTWIWINECVKQGIKELKGYELKPSDPRWMADFLRRIAYREGEIGALFAEGLRRAVDKLDVPENLKELARFEEPMYGFNSHRVGRANEGNPAPLWIVNMLLWVTDTRDPISSRGAHKLSWQESYFPPFEPVNWGGASGVNSREHPIFKKMEAVSERIYGKGALKASFEPIDVKVGMAIFHQHRGMMDNSLILCEWAYPIFFRSFETEEELRKASPEELYGDLDAESKLFDSVTGLNIGTKGLEKAAERMINLARAVAVRNDDRSRKNDTSHLWYFKDYPEKSKVEPRTVGEKTFNKMLDRFYRLRGWDVKTGRPTRSKLEELNLEDVADELGKAGKLPPH